MAVDDNNVITIVREVEPEPGRAIATLSASPTPPWQAAFEAFCRWAKGIGAAPPGVPAEQGVSTAVMNSSIQISRDAIHITMPPGTRYAEVAPFIRSAVDWANTSVVNVPISDGSDIYNR